MSDGQALTRKYFIDKLRYILRSDGMNDKEFSGHSFRHEAASTCGSEKIPDYLTLKCQSQLQQTTFINNFSLFFRENKT